MNKRSHRALLILVSSLGLELSAQEGGIDATFNPSDAGYGLGDGTDGELYAVAVRPDNRGIIGGSTTYYNSTLSRGLAGTTSAGLLDPTFTVGNGAEGSVKVITLQSDGKPLVGGQFNILNGAWCGRVARLNANGTVDASFSSTVGADATVECIAVQPDGKILIGGWFTSWDGVPRNRLARLNANGTLDVTFNVGTGFAGTYDRVQAIVVQPDGKILVAGDFLSYNGTAAGNIIRLFSNGTPDSSFDPGTGTDSHITTMALQPDGLVLIGGSFFSINGTQRQFVARLTSTGAVDTTFDPGASANNTVNTLKLRPDGKILIGGEFTTVAGTGRSRIALLNTSGSLDPGFDPGSGADASVRNLAIRPDGKVLVVGNFRYFNGKGCGRVVLLEANGTMDLSYNPVNGANGPVDAMVRQADGRILIGGDFTGVNGQGRKRITRLMADGTLDASFNPGAGANWPITTFAVQQDGKIIAAGNMDQYNGTAVKRIVRLNTDGAIDPTFQVVQGVNNSIIKCVLQPDGKILISGYFTTFNGISRNRIARLNANGTLDTSFDPGTGADGWISEMIILADGRIVICGVFTAYNGAPRRHLARLNVNGSLDPSFDPGAGPGTGSTYVRDMVKQPDGRLVITGSFTTYNGMPRARIARIMENGALDTSFDPGTGINSSSIFATLVDPDGRILIGGNFTQYNNTPRQGLARINADGSLDNSFNPGSGVPSWISRILPLEDGDILLSGNFTAYNGTGRNRIARINGTPRTGIKLSLEGPYSGSTMTDALRTLPSFPLTEPFTALGYSNALYTPGATIGSSILATTGNNAIVDWVLVEMRPEATPSVIAASRAVLLQRDGDVVDLDGVSNVGFAGLAPGNYCVAVKPRNHLPVMSATSAPVAYGAATAAVDFTLPGTLVYDNDARKNVGGVMLMAAGDVTFNGTVRYTGTGNDRDPIILRVGGSTPNNTVSGYWREDVNMDGVVKYTGTANDRDIILTNVGSTTPNSTRVATLP